MKKLMNQLKISAKLLGLMIVLFGLVYPLLTTGIANLLFPDQAEGSLIEQDSHILGSSLIGQQFTDPAYFHSRPAVNQYQSAGASNLSVAGDPFLAGVQIQLQKEKQDNPDASQPVPIDLLTSSGSGLDPDISPAAALFQIPRVAKARNMDPSDLEKLVARQTLKRQFNLFGEERVNVLELNLLLDQLQK